MVRLDRTISLSGGTLKPVPTAWDGPVGPGHDDPATLEPLAVLIQL